MSALSRAPWIAVAVVALVGPAATQTNVPRFDNVQAASGITFVLANAPTPDKRLIETMPGGLAAFDYDGDGLVDLFFANGNATPAVEKASPAFHNRLYRNRGNFQFEDVTDAAGLQGRGFAMGAAAADYDNDGQIDLFVPGVGQPMLYRNVGKGRFEDVTTRAGLKGSPWSVAAAWVDIVIITAPISGSAVRITSTGRAARSTFFTTFRPQISGVRSLRLRWPRWSK